MRTKNAPPELDRARRWSRTEANALVARAPDLLSIAVLALDLARGLALEFQARLLAADPGDGSLVTEGCAALLKDPIAAVLRFKMIDHKTPAGRTKLALVPAPRLRVVTEGPVGSFGGLSAEEGSDAGIYGEPAVHASTVRPESGPGEVRR